MLKLVHDSVRGRARFKIRGLNRDKGFKEYLEGVLPRQSGVSKATACTATGNLLVCYNSEMTSLHLTALVKQAAADFHRKRVSPPPAAKDSKSASLPAPAIKKLYLSKTDRLFYSHLTVTILAVFYKHDK